MTTTEKRPRIDPGLATRIDLARGNKPFETFVRDTLHAALSPVWIVEKDPARKLRFRVITDPDVGTDEVAASGLSRSDAEVYAGLLNAISIAEDALTGAAEDLDGMEEIEYATISPLIEEMTTVADRLYDIMGHKLGEPVAQ